MSDEQLIADYLQGDERALEQLVDRHIKAVYRFVLGLTGDREGAEDITQESFMKAWKHIRSYRQGESFQTWLFSIARNSAIDWLRTRRDVHLSSFENESGENTLLAVTADPAPHPDELIARAEDERFVSALLSGIGPSYRDVLALRYQDDFTFKEIAHLLQKPLHTVKSQHRRAISMLRKLFYARGA